MTETWHGAGMAPEDVMAEIERLRGMIRSLAAERDDLREALKRHTHFFTDPGGGVLCGGCLEPAPCKDTALLKTGTEEEK